MRHLIPISGKDSLATAILQRAHVPHLNYEYIFNPTGSEYEEVFEWLEKVEQYLGSPIIRVGENLEEIIERKGFFLPGPKTRYCTEQSKINPFKQYVGTEPVTVYFGIRADEERVGFDNSKTPHIIPNYPLKDHGIDIRGVYILLNSVGLKPPVFFWGKLFDEVQRLFPGVDLKSRLDEITFDILFSGRTRANCFHCFNQSEIEWVWLYFEKPDLFEKSKWYESQGSKPEEVKEIDVLGEIFEYVKPQKNYHWNSDYSLDILASRAEKIFKKHVLKVAGAIQIYLNQGKLTDTRGGSIDILSATSCGLFCGK